MLNQTTPVIKRTRSGSGSLSSSSSFALEHKRLRNSLSLADSPMSTPGSNSLTKRRVNPESLAMRLGPQLVNELEALLQPGATEMPPFHVRQAIQKRYNIDRRHIYDWFHSKGLRVTKDDKRHAMEDEPPIGGSQVPVRSSVSKSNVY